MINKPIIKIFTVALLIVAMVSCRKINQHVESIKLDKQEVDLAMGLTVTLTADLRPYNADDRRVIWTSSNENVATVSAIPESIVKGVVSGKSVGTAMITAATKLS
jgi:uncharacterized protein YjdB